MSSEATGDENVVIGAGAGSDKQTGARNVIIGTDAGLSCEAASNCIFIGFQAGYSETGNNKLIIENSSNIETPLIYGDFGDKTLTINGDLNVTGTLYTDGVAIPTDIYSRAEVDTVSGTLNTKIDTTSGTLQSEIDAIPPGITTHSGLSDLDYASAGHTGFQPAGSYSTTAEVDTVSGTLNDKINLKVNTTDLTELTQDVIGTSVSGVNITVTYDDNTGITTLSGSTGGGGLSNIVEDLTPELGGELDTNSKNIRLTPVPADDSASGLIATLTVDTNSVGVGAALYMAVDGHFDEADADQITTMPCTALALETGTGAKKVLLFGFMRNDDWNWSPGGIVYVSTVSGTLTQATVSGTGDQVQIVGYATHVDRMYFNPIIAIAEVK
jgi:hypothetical protein